LRLAFAAAQRPSEESAASQSSLPQVGVAVGAALLFAAAATFVLGVVPGEVLRSAQEGAHTLQTPVKIQETPPVTATEQPNP
ncbi:MAG: hypothetical protein WBY75_03455, partial [Terracidiphilus sp.]